MEDDFSQRGRRLHEAMGADPLLGVFLEIIPPKDQSIYDWAEENVILPARIPGQYAGPYRVAITPYMRGVFDALRDPHVNVIAVEAGAQTGKTIAAYIALAYWCAVAPGPVLIVYPTEDIARSMSETRIMPIFEDSPELAKLIPHDRKNAWQKLQYRLAKNVVNFVGANSPANLASRPAKYVIMDEVDKYPPTSGKESDPVSLVMERVKTFFGYKVLMLSTPTSSSGSIHVAFTQGDQRRYQAPCPYCGGKQVLAWEQVKFDDKQEAKAAAKDARYECLLCKARFDDHQRAVAVSRGAWEPTKESESEGRVSFHVPSLLSPWTRHARLVSRFLNAKHDRTRLMGFINGELGEPYDPIDTRIYDDILVKREGGYPDGKDWADCEAFKARFKGLTRCVSGAGDYATIMGVDVQKGYFVGVARTFMRNGDSAQTWRGELSGFDALLRIADTVKAEYIGMDMRYRGQEVLEFCHMNHGFFPTYGQTRKASNLVIQEDGYDIDEGKRRPGDQRRAVTRFAVSTDQTKDILEGCIRQSEGHPLWLLPTGAASDKAYCDQMTAEARVNGKWVNPRQKANHYFDAECICLAMASVFGFWDWGNEPEPDDENK